MVRKDPDDMPTPRPARRGLPSPRVNARKPSLGRASRCGACSDISFIRFPESDLLSVASTPTLPPRKHSGESQQTQPSPPPSLPLCETRFTRELQPNVRYSASPYDIRVSTAREYLVLSCFLRTYYCALSQRSRTGLPFMSSQSCASFAVHHP